MHKFVCGPRSKPFCWPGFSQQEIDELLALLQKPTIKRGLDDIICAHGGFERFKVGQPPSLHHSESFLTASVVSGQNRRVERSRLANRFRHAWARMLLSSQPLLRLARARH